MSRPSIISYAALAAAVLVGGWWWQRGTAESRVVACFANLESAIERGHVGDSFAALDHDYDPLAHWPQLAEIDLGEASEPLFATGEEPPGWRLARSLLRAVYLAHEGEARDVRLQVSSVVRLADSRLEARVTVAVDAPASPALVVREQPDHRFVLRERGWFLPVARIAAHDAIATR